jgi:DNA-binding MarR family transcriptional regulator
VALVDHLVERGFVRRQPSETDRRQVMVALTRPGEALLRRLSALHRKQLETVGADLVRALQTIMQDRGPAPP